MFLLIVRERLFPGMEEAYRSTELEIAAACATLNCPHPYLALASIDGPKEVWWLNAFASQEEKDRIGAAYARNEPLMAKLQLLGTRKDALRETLSATLAEYRPDLSDTVLRVAGMRFVVMTITRDEPAAEGAVFESSDGERFVIRSADTREKAERIAARSGQGALILALRPEWSFPAEEWVAGDPDFWSSSRSTQPR